MDLQTRRAGKVLCQSTNSGGSKGRGGKKKRSWFNRGGGNDMLRIHDSSGDSWRKRVDNLGWKKKVSATYKYRKIFPVISNSRGRGGTAKKVKYHGAMPESTLASCGGCITRGFA